jgi:hypothetical protein
MKSDKQLEYPGMRWSLIDTLKDMSDINVQKKDWLTSLSDKNFFACIREPINCLFDIPFREYPEKQIGITIRNWKEIDTLNELGKAIDKFYAESKKGKNTWIHPDGKTL